MGLEIIVLAAGHGKRMQSNIPKVLHNLGGRPLIHHVLRRAQELNPTKIHVVHGIGSKGVQNACVGFSVNWVEQKEQLGTGHAVRQVIPHVLPTSTILVLYGDVPLVDGTTLQQCIELGQTELALVTAIAGEPTGFGRIVRRDGVVRMIVEEKDLHAEQRCIDEINSGILCGPQSVFQQHLPELDPDNAQGEFYLTDIVGMVTNAGNSVRTIKAIDEVEVAGVNTRRQLAALEREYQRRQADSLMAAGTTIADPARIDIRGEVVTGKDCFIDINVVLEGEITFGDGVSIGPNCVLRDVSLSDGVEIRPNSVVEGAIIGERSTVGPFARVRPETEIGDDVRIGNFVEIKKGLIHDGATAAHLTYIGDAEVGSATNIGAGTITCNYDGTPKKKRTKIGANCFVGSNTTLVAPLVIEDNAFIGAGSTITKTVRAKQLAIGRSRQTQFDKWTPPSDRKRNETA